MKFQLLCLSFAALLISGCLFTDTTSDEDVPLWPPADPSELTHDVSVPYELTLRWKDNADNEDGYYLGVSTRLPANTTEWTFTDLDSPTYRFELIAFNTIGTSNSVYFEEVKIKWNYPHIYKVVNIYTESNGTKGTDTANGFVAVYEDSVAISFDCTVGGQERVVDIFAPWPYSMLTFTLENALFTQHFENVNDEQSQCSIRAIRVDSMDEILN